MTANNLKGIHPGRILKQELKKRRLKYSKFAVSINESPEKLEAVINGSQPIYTALSLKMEKFLCMEEGYFMIQQVYYDISQEKKKNTVGSTGISAPLEINKRSPLKCIGSEKKQQYLKKLDAAFTEQKIYLKNDLTLKDVSKKTLIPMHHLSSIINSELNVSFIDYVNLKRMQHFIKSLYDVQWENLSLEDLALKSGFKSRTSCFRFFIKQTGSSVSQYIKKVHPQAVKKRGYIRKPKIK